MQQKRSINNAGYIQYPNGTVEFTAVPGQTLNTSVNPLGNETMIITTPQYATNAIYQPATIYDTSSFGIKPNIVPSVVTEVTRTEYYTPGNNVSNFNYGQAYDYATQQVQFSPPVAPIVFPQVPQQPISVSPTGVIDNFNANNKKYDTLEEDIKSIKEGIEKLKEDFKETSILSFSNERDTQDLESPGGPMPHVPPVMPIPKPIFAPPVHPAPAPPYQQRPRRPQPNNANTKQQPVNSVNNKNKAKKQPIKSPKKKKDPLSIVLIVIALLILIGTGVFLGLYFGTDLLKNLF